MKISSNGLNLIKKYEGCRLTAYRDSGNTLTIGYGHTKNVSEGMTITQEQADAFLLEDCTNAVNAVNKYMSIYNFNQNQFDALVSIAFNIGSIKQLTADGTRTIQEISAKIPEYCKCAGKTLQGLVNRRNEEKALFDSANNVFTPTIPTAPQTTTYIIEKGDTLSGIAKKYNTTIAELQRLNNIADPNKIVAGKTLIVSGATPKTYIIKYGDTLSGIAKKYNTTIAELQRLNNIADPNKIVAGKTLIVG